MLAVPDAARAAEWYKRALGAEQLWNLGSVVGLDIQGAAFFVGEPSNNGWETRRSSASTPSSSTSSRNRICSSASDSTRWNPTRSGHQTMRLVSIAPVSIAAGDSHPPLELIGDTAAALTALADASYGPYDWTRDDERSFREELE